ncbi:MAG: tRNA threonylcarbamoyladenosine dehydratase [Kiritimatiellaceae bacterium]|nr:tRNA threonylcarbamoyladenosine dehydratase [Kiritimatiellaceae bacterium]
MMMRRIMKKHPSFHRTELLIGNTALQRLAAARVVLFGVGGVGSWCAEALIRSGVGHLTIVDNDVICVTNINRQLQATSKNIGKSKVETLKTRLLEIHPEADVTALQKVYNQETREEFALSSYDYVIDAIDSLSHKVDLIASAMEAGVTLFSAMGAANKLDATTIRVDSIWKSQGCRLAKFVRKRLRSRGVTGDCLCVYSEEMLEAFEAVPAACGSAQCFCPKQLDDEGNEVPSDVWCHQKAQINGSMVHITGAFGFHLAGLVVQDIVRKASA